MSNRFVNLPCTDHGRSGHCLFQHECQIIAQIVRMYTHHRLCNQWKQDCLHRKSNWTGHRPRNCRLIIWISCPFWNHQRCHNSSQFLSIWSYHARRCQAQHLCTLALILHNKPRRLSPTDWNWNHQLVSVTLIRIRRRMVWPHRSMHLLPRCSKVERLRVHLSLYVKFN